MNLWYIVSDATPIDEWGDELYNYTQYEFDQFSSQEDASKHIKNIKGKKSKKPIIALVDWKAEFWELFYKTKQTV